MNIAHTHNPESWVDEHGDALFRFAASRLRDRDGAEEVVQQTFVAALQHIDQFSGKGSIRPWLMGILRRKIVDLVRQRSRTTTLPEHDDTADYFDEKGNWRPMVRNAKQAPLDSVEREEFWKLFQECLGKLPGSQADIFVLRELDDLNSEEICKEMKISSSNLWVTLYRARLQLSHCMKRHR